MTALPAKTSISDTYPNPSNAVARAGFAQLWDVLNEMSEKSELDLASAATCDIGGQASRKLRITGTTTITSFGTNYRGLILLRMAGIVTITHDGTILICPGATNLVTAAGDILLASQKATTSGTPDGWQVARIARGDGSATLLGAPTAPTASVNTNTTQLATTAFVIAQIKVGPAFRAINVGAQSLSTGVSTKVTLGTESFDTAACFASSRFTPTTAGYYRLNGAAILVGTNITIALLSIFLNGSEITRGTQLNDASGTADIFGAEVSDTVYLNGSTDYVEIYAVVTAGTPSVAAALARFSGSLARPA